jgi:hypothetical protein
MTQRVVECVLALLVLVVPSARADDWSLPEPVGFRSRGFSYVAEVFPPKSRQNPSDKPVCYFYEMEFGEFGGQEFGGQDTAIWH